MKPNSYGRIFFDLLLTFFVLSLTIFSFKYKPIERMIPLIISIPTLIMLIFVTVKDCFAKPKITKAESSASPKNDNQSAVLKIILWVIVFSISIFFLGFYIPMILFTFTFLIIEAELKWHRSLIVTCIVSSAMYVMFDLSLKLVLWPGMIPEIIPDILGGGVLPPL